MKKLFRNISLFMLAILSLACEKESLFDKGDPNISLVPVYEATIANATSGKGYNIIETPTTINLYKDEAVLYHYIGQRVIKVESTFSTEDFVPANVDSAIPGKFKFDYRFDADDISTETATSTTTVIENTTVTFEGNNTDENGDVLLPITGTLLTTNTIVSTTVRPKTAIDVTTAQTETQAATNDLAEILTEIIVDDENSETTVIQTILKTGQSPVSITESEVYN